LQPWREEDLIFPTQEQSIMNNWKLNNIQSLAPHPHPSSQGNNPSHWSPPPADFFKLNFDGASKGNPGAAGFGAVIRNQQGSILLLTAGNLGHTTNNAAELWGLTTGLQLALKHHFNKLIVEGDSQIILNLF
jgi:hypothetical protein